jgi:hypothetical protein
MINKKKEKAFIFLLLYIILMIWKKESRMDGGKGKH